MAQPTHERILEFGTITQVNHPQIYEYVRSNVLSLFRSGILVDNDGEGTLVVCRIKSQENTSESKPEQKSSTLKSFKGKIHKQTATTCLVCGEEIEGTGFVLHKTRRQTHTLCLECAEGYLKPIVENMTDQIRRGLRRDKLNILQCPGNVQGEHRNMCSCKLKIQDLFKTNYEQRTMFVKRCTTPGNCDKVTYSSGTYKNTKGKLCKCLHYNESIQNYIKRTGINLISPPRLDPGSDLGTMIFRVSYVLDDPNRCICPNRQCGMVVESDPHIQKISCENCQTSWCRNCNVSPYHENMSCMAYESSQSQTEDGKYKWELYQKGELKDCPSCYAPTLKRSGCNKMYCEQCKTKWCWICRKIGVDYDHFNDQTNGACAGRLWEGVED